MLPAEPAESSSRCVFERVCVCVSVRLNTEGIEQNFLLLLLLFLFLACFLTKSLALVECVVCECVCETECVCGYSSVHI